MANSDWVVGIFPKTFQTLRLQDLGSGGFDGFLSLASTDQVEFIDGGHGAALDEMYWSEMAEFIVNGTFANKGNFTRSDRSLLMRAVGKIAPLIFAAGIALVLGLGILLYFLLPCCLDDGYKLIILALYAFLIYRILTRF